MWLFLTWKFQRILWKWTTIRCFESTAQHGGVMKPPFGVARVVSIYIYIYPCPGVKVTETNRGCLKKSTIQWCLAKVDGVRSGSGKNTMFLWAFGGRKRNKSQFRHFGDVSSCINPCIIHGSCCISTMPTFYGVMELAPVSLCSSLSPENTLPTFLVLSTTLTCLCLAGNSLPSDLPRFLLCKWYKYSDAAGTQPFGPFAVSMFHRFTERKAPDPGVPWTQGFPADVKILLLGGGFKYLFIFTPTWWRFPFWLIFFKGVGFHQLVLRWESWLWKR